MYKKKFMKFLYEDAVIERRSFQDQEIKGIEFLDCSFIKCDFSNSVFRFCKYSGCVFNDCDLSLIGISGSLLFRTKFEECKLVGVNWTRAAW